MESKPRRTQPLKRSWAFELGKSFGYLHRSMGFTHPGATLLLIVVVASSPFWIWLLIVAMSQNVKSGSAYPDRPTFDEPYTPARR